MVIAKKGLHNWSRRVRKCIQYSKREIGKYRHKCNLIVLKSPGTINVIS